MKTTIDFPDDLLHRAKIAALQRKTTLKDIVLQGVNYVITHPATPSEAHSRGQNTELVGSLERDEIHDRQEDRKVTSADVEETQRQISLRRLLAAMKASNTEPMSPLTRAEIYAER